jgi:hypothetical protein
MMAKRAGTTVVEVAGSRAIHVSQPEAAAKIIGQQRTARSKSRSRSGAH